jgi:glycosyltransferase involved in cell wall biosynthesis
MPTKVAEYLASGVPTVLTTTGDIARFVEDGVSAYLVPPGDRPALVQAIRRVLSDRDDAGAVGRRGREVAARYFDYRVAGDTVSAFIARVRGEGRAVRPAPCRSGRRWGSA